MDLVTIRWTAARGKVKNKVASIVEDDAETSVQNLELPTDAGEEDFDRGLKNRHIQMIALGGAIGTGLFYGSATSIGMAGPSIALAYLRWCGDLSDHAGPGRDAGVHAGLRLLRHYAW